MKRWFTRPTHIVLVLMMVYGAYLFKTAMGINVSNQYSASGIFKAPIRPFWSHGTELCAEFQTLCTLRNEIRHKVQRRIEQVKRAV